MLQTWVLTESQRVPHDSTSPSEAILNIPSLRRGSRGCSSGAEPLLIRSPLAPDRELCGFGVLNAHGLPVSLWFCMKCEELPGLQSDERPFLKGLELDVHF